MDHFKLIRHLAIKKCSLCPVDNFCFFYDFERAGLVNEDLVNFFENKCIDIYQYNKSLLTPLRAKKCPWCKVMYDDLEGHIFSAHKKKVIDYNLFKMQLEIYYKLLLPYVRNNNYDALSFMIQGECVMCVEPRIKGREGMCALPESARNKIRSLTLLGFACEGFDVEDFDLSYCGILYQRRPVF